MPRTPGSKRTDSEFHPRLDRLDSDVNLVDQAVDVLTAPVIPSQPSTGIAVPAVTRGVWEVDCIPALVSFLVWIEIVVDVNAIDVVALDDVEHDLGGAPPNRRLPRIHPEVPAIPLHELRISPADVVGRYGRLC